MIRHLVALKLSDDVDQTAVDEAMQALQDLRQHIDGIVDFAARKNISPEHQVVRGFKHLFWFDFENEAVRDTYLEDERHKAIGSRLVAMADGGVDGIFVCDFEI